MPLEGQVRLYLDRAVDLRRTFQLVRDDVEHRYSSALLAIHSAISFADALRVGLGDEHLSSENHQEAVAALKRALQHRRPNDLSGLQHYEYLISQKSIVAYGAKELTSKQMQRLTKDAERFAQWANTLGAKLNIEGWRE